MVTIVFMIMMILVTIMLVITLMIVYLSGTPPGFSMSAAEPPTPPPAPCGLLSPSCSGVGLCPSCSSSTLSGDSRASCGASMAVILEVRAAMIRLFSRLASSRDLTRSCSSALRRSVRSFGWSAVVRDWSSAALPPAACCRVG